MKYVAMVLPVGFFRTAEDHSEDSTPIATQLFVAVNRRYDFEHRPSSAELSLLFYAQAEELKSSPQELRHIEVYLFRPGTEPTTDEKFRSACLRRTAFATPPEYHFRVDAKSYTQVPVPVS